MKYKAILPEYYLSESKFKQLGWHRGTAPSDYAAGKMMRKGIFENFNGHLPTATGRIWYEADINYKIGKRNSSRILWSNDGLIFVTYDHYKTFYEII